MIEPNRGARVRPIDADFVRDVVWIEVLIEPALTRSFQSRSSISPTSSGWRRSRPRSRRSTSPTSARHGQLDTRFHQIIYDRHYNRHAAELWWKRRRTSCAR